MLSNEDLKYLDLGIITCDAANVLVPLCSI
jgi:hypothetical protein